MQISVVVKADVRRTLLEAASELASLRSKALAVASKLAQTRDSADAADIALRQMSLIGTPIERDNFADREDIATLDGAYESLIKLAELCREMGGQPVFTPESSRQ